MISEANIFYHPESGCEVLSISNILLTPPAPPIITVELYHSARGWGGGRADPG